MAKKHKHEDHVNHEAWAIPYGDLVTLLLAFFVVMYAVSSVNEGKYRVAAMSMSEAFNGTPRTIVPVQIGETAALSSGAKLDMGLMQAVNQGIASSPIASQLPGGVSTRGSEIEQMAEEVEAALADLIAEKIVVVRTSREGLEVEIQTDILFPSGTATLSRDAVHILQRLSRVLVGFQNPVRVEGHTDNVPIRTVVFPSNWELSAARAASVVHLLMEQGLAPQRLAVIGVGEYRPVAANDTVVGRNRNRRVVLVIPASQDMAGSLRDVSSAAHSPAAAAGPVTPSAPARAPASASGGL